MVSCRVCQIHDARLDVERVPTPSNEIRYLASGSVSFGRSQTRGRVDETNISKYKIFLGSPDTAHHTALAEVNKTDECERSGGCQNCCEPVYSALFAGVEP